MDTTPGINFYVQFGRQAKWRLVYGRGKNVESNFGPPHRGAYTRHNLCIGPKLCVLNFIPSILHCRFELTSFFVFLCLPGLLFFLPAL